MKVYILKPLQSQNDGTILATFTSNDDNPPPQFVKDHLRDMGYQLSEHIPECPQDAAGWDKMVGEEILAYETPYEGNEG